MTLVQSLSNHISNIKLETTDVPIPEKAGLLIEVLKALNPDTQHSSDNFVYIGHRAEHLPVFENSETFWLSPMKIMSLEQYGSCSSRNEELLKTWIFLYGFKKENPSPTVGEWLVQGDVIALCLPVQGLCIAEPFLLRNHKPP